MEFSTDLLKQFIDEASSKLYKDTDKYLDLLVEKRLFEKAAKYLHTCDYNWFNPKIYDHPILKNMIAMGFPIEYFPRIVGYYDTYQVNPRSDDSDINNIIKEHIRNTHEKQNFSSNQTQTIFTRFVTLDGLMFTKDSFGDKIELAKQNLQHFGAKSNNRPPMSQKQFEKLQIHSTYLCDNCSDYLNDIKLQYDCSGGHCLGGTRINRGQGLSVFVKFDKLEYKGQAKIQDGYGHYIDTLKTFEKLTYMNSEIKSEPYIIDTKYSAEDISMMFYKSEINEKKAKNSLLTVVKLNDEIDIKLAILNEKEISFNIHHEATIAYLERERLEITKQKEKLLRQSQIVDKNVKKFQKEFKDIQKIKAIKEVRSKLFELIIEAEIYLPDTFSKKIEDITAKLDDANEDSDLEVPVSCAAEVSYKN